MIQRLAVVGLGLLGGSVAKAARAHGLARAIVGVGRDRARLQPALSDGGVDEIVTDLGAGLRGADLVVLAAPVLVNEELLRAAWPLVERGAVVTDVGSTKAGIVRAAERLQATRAVAFVGSHPMAGSEQSGYAVARADLFAGATVIVTPTDGSEPRAVKTVTQFWEATGARVTALDPMAHDRAVAAVSHLPHVVAWALVDAVTRFEPGAFDVAARGFKDTTRIAASDPVVWREILLANREAVGAGVRAFREALDALDRLIADGDAAAIDATLARIKATRERVR